MFGLRCRVSDISEGPPCCLPALELCLEAWLGVGIWYVGEGLSGAGEPSMHPRSACMLFRRRFLRPLALQVPICEHPSILILYLPSVSKHLVGAFKSPQTSLLCGCQQSLCLAQLTPPARKETSEKNLSQSCSCYKSSTTPDLSRAWMHAAANVSTRSSAKHTGIKHPEVTNC